MRKVHKRYIEHLKKSIVSYYGERLVSIVLFGSMARGTATPESDVDILLIAEKLNRRKKKRIEEFMSNVEDNIGDMPFYISPVIKAPAEASSGSPLFLDMVYDALILYDKEKFFENIIGRLRRRLKELGSRRVFKGSKWYWILKPDLKIGEVVEL